MTLAQAVVLRLQSRYLLQTRQPAEGYNLAKECMTVHAAQPPALVSTWSIICQGDKLYKISKTFNVTLLCTPIKCLGNEAKDVRFWRHYLSFASERHTLESSNQRTVPSDSKTSKQMFAYLALAAGKTSGWFSSFILVKHFSKLPLPGYYYRRQSSELGDKVHSTKFIATMYIVSYINIRSLSRPHCVCTLIFWVPYVISFLSVEPLAAADTLSKNRSHTVFQLGRLPPPPL